MRIMRLLAFSVLFCVASASLQAAVLLSTNDQITSADPTMTGRMTRDGLPSVWGTNKVFPGAFATTTIFSYTTYTIDVGYLRFIQVSVDDPFVGVFAAAYHTSFTPAPGPTATNYLGDAGSSGNPFGNPNFFQVEVPKNKDLVLMVLNVPALSSGLGVPYGILIEGFSDANYNEVPEPATAALMAGALGILVVARRHRRR